MGGDLEFGGPQLLIVGPDLLGQGSAEKGEACVPAAPGGGQGQLSPGRGPSSPHV